MNRSALALLGASNIERNRRRGISGATRRARDGLDCGRSADLHPDKEAKGAADRPGCQSRPPSLACSDSRRRRLPLDHGPNFGAESVQREWLGQHIHAGVEKIAAERGVFRISGDEQHF
jgi:hypothetical protein